MTHGGLFSIARFYRLNHYINAPQLRVIGADGKQIGILDRQKALDTAKENGLDLVEIAPSAKPPVAKIIDFQKFKYEESKKERLSKKKTRETDTKEIWLGPLIGNHDLKTRLERAKEFLTSGDRVKLSVRFSGREMAHPEFGHDVLKRSTEYLKEIATQERAPKFEGRNLTAIYAPIKEV
ncbi:MAG: translation initiation factor IF-3 [Candidatus Woykebacteria bacterium RIFCSPHIGHO2_12_FULL_43_10]|uniref:Translation initiation factor IF-3 n=2 Tax=Candidatus Woykeibacteriota TaxID=1817899 RepID=A0A1G1WWY1_9BACT|nr:MAG: translation initiation factor IF-3 [Candidatus Woykebacteria bacterium RIFCSPHIGHO2_02_FULL_43_16b]OGY28653.1 MAG: translation initiation factor IF-3 [Candidatus Woykebacteria bacterium RIFCSPHIGHO2_01_FULL_43_29]OGY28784.1 MAG: translation initiation factor IF-3 [Candidatus Woykebacteria bacterium RIFCSPHIGHO2_12_FULL_43_10]OGY32194.1 MAG: translation initiation factor IF-3 [Candidatus Woykebacteria bacterium RIFCSPLOWO2_01_FULL_43_14]